MKFDFNKDPYEDLNVVAEAYYMNDDPGSGVCLCVKASEEEYIWFYQDGEVSVQENSFDKNPIKKFYKGDSITITF